MTEVEKLIGTLTIIAVILVLVIIGLIFLAIFLKKI